MMKQDSCIISLHIKRTGGTTLRYYFDSILGHSLSLEYTISSKSHPSHIRAIHGYHVFENSVDLIQKKLPIYITFLRDPLSRAISLFHYNKNNMPTSLGSLHQFLISDYSWHSYERIEQSMPIRFEQFDFIGITERLSEGVSSLCRKYGLPNRRISTIHNVGNYGNPTIANKLRRRFMALYSRDYDIYNEAKDRK